jgi:alkaline phosphatase
MKLRNQLLALFCLLLFIAFGVVFFRTWVVQKPFGIILFAGDGLTTSMLAAARLYEGGGDYHLTLESLPHLALLRNHARDFAVPDDASAATALATGVKADNRSIAMDQGKPIRSILEAAQAEGRAVGFVTTGNLTDAGTAAFYAHEARSDQVGNIAAQLVDSARLDVVLGGGAGDFTPESKGGRRKDGRDLLIELRDKGTEVLRTKAELENAATFRTSNVFGVFSSGNLAYSNEVVAGSQQPSLTDMVRRAIQFLQFNRKGYLLVVDTELAGRAAEQNDGEHAITETLDLDHAVATALNYAGEKALILVAGKHAIGGMTLNGYPLRQDYGVALIGTNAFGYPSITWSTGPNGPLPNPAATPAASEAQPQPTPAPATAKNQPAAFFAPAAISNADDVVALGVGPGSQELSGFLDNTIIFQIVMKNL